MRMNPIYLKDMYKVGHVDQYPPNTTLLFSNFTPRKHDSVFFGLKYFMRKYLQDAFDTNFFGKLTPRIHQHAYKRMMSEVLGSECDFQHIHDLDKLGYLPIAIYALPERTLVPKGVPALVMYNTHSDFFWLPNMLETLMSCTLWGACNSATIAYKFRSLLDKYAEQTCDDNLHVDYQAHDFSMRGMFGVEAAVISGMAHLQYFSGTDTLPALISDQYYYDMPLHQASIPATEHSVMSAYGKGRDELNAIQRLINEVYPSGFVSIVSDTWDLWKVIDEYLPALKDDIMARDGRVVIRPDSGDPVEILCGHWESCHASISPAKGVIDKLWEIFGGTVNSKGYRVLDPHIGCIYGDGISLDRANLILSKLESKGYASSNIVFGIGSYTYQYNTRDTLGWAMKSTYCEVKGVGRAITKDPVTDDGTKKSASGLLMVMKDGDELKLKQDCTWDEFHSADNQLKCVFKDGVIY